MKTEPWQGRHLLLLLPLIDREDLPHDTIEILGAALAQCTTVEQPHRIAELLLAAGPA